MSITLNYGPRLELFAYRPPELDCPINILEGSIRSGKTWAMIPKVMQLCLYPVTGYRVMTGLTKDAIYRNVLNDLFGIIGPSNYHYNQQSGFLKLFNKDWVVIGAKDEGSEKFIRGMTVGAALCDELSQTPQSFFEMLLTRMSPAGARLYATTNPDSPLHWLKKDYLDKKSLRDNRELWSMHCTMDDNPNLTDDFKDRQKRFYRGLFYQRNILGLWVMAEGVIYRDCWGEQSTFEDVDLPMGLFGAGGTQQRVVTVDYGTKNPCVFLDFRDDGKTFWGINEYRWDSEHEMRQKTDGEYATDMEKFLKGDKSVQIVIDPSAASFQLELERKGFWVTHADNEVLSGIQKTSTALAQGVLRFHRTRCSRTIQEFQTYAWDPKKAAKGIEEPIKAGDHGCDATRYFVETIIPDWRLG